MIYDYKDDCARVIGKRIRDLEVKLGRGGAGDWESYNRIVGEIRGLNQSLDEMNDVAKKHGRIDDDE